MWLRMQRVFLCACILLLPESEKHHPLENNESHLQLFEVADDFFIRLWYS